MPNDHLRHHPVQWIGRFVHRELPAGIEHEFSCDRRTYPHPVVKIGLSGEGALERLRPAHQQIFGHFGRASGLHWLDEQPKYATLTVSLTPQAMQNWQQSWQVADDFKIVSQFTDNVLAAYDVPTDLHEEFSGAHGLLPSLHVMIDCEFERTSRDLELSARLPGLFPAKFAHTEGALMRDPYAGLTFTFKDSDGAAGYVRQRVQQNPTHPFHDGLNL